MENWIDIHENFAKVDDDKTYQQRWEEENLTPQDAQEWITAGFKPDDYDKVKQWKDHNFTPQQTQSWIKKGLTLDDYDLQLT
ncbi:MAG: hypothetical protein MRECE_9c018 [Mycoplasmataceae bacterium CE_OT135]|nr:MAG: hypothetical protein MRECE_9c018 [Mycoplasmataceae bacterium CE_OT135]